MNTCEGVGTRALIFGLLTLVCGLCTAWSQPILAAEAEWTVMVYMNAKNNLEGAGIDDFIEMSKVGSSAEINVVTQFGRPSGHWDDRFGPWSGVKRYRITTGLEPRADEALLSLAPQSAESDMGNPQSLIDFVLWARQNYPAKRYMLIVWNHGQGWRLQLTATQKTASTKRAPRCRPRSSAGSDQCRTMPIRETSFTTARFKMV